MYLALPYFHAVSTDIDFTGPFHFCPDFFIFFFHLTCDISDVICFGEEKLVLAL